jgi:hypothetical protein
MYELTYSQYSPQQEHNHEMVVILILLYPNVISLAAALQNSSGSSIESLYCCSKLYEDEMEEKDLENLFILETINFADLIMIADNELDWLIRLLNIGNDFLKNRSIKQYHKTCSIFHIRWSFCGGVH